MAEKATVRRLVTLVVISVTFLMGASAAGSLHIRSPKGWTVAGHESDAVVLKPPPGSPFRDATIFNPTLLLSRDIDALMPLARAVFPAGARVGEQSGRKVSLDGYAAVEIWGGATLGDDTLSQATLFLWRGTRMIPVSVLMNGSDSAPARAIAEKIARGVSIASTATFFPVPGSPPGIVGPANWTPRQTKGATLTAKVVAPDPEEEGPPGSINYELLPRSLEPTLDAVLGGLEALARARGAERIRTSGVETRAGRRPVLVFQQTIDERFVVTGAVIRYPEATLRVTYFDRPDRAEKRKPLFDALVERLAESDLKGPFGVQVDDAPKGD